MAMTKTAETVETRKLDVRTVSKIFSRDGRTVRALDPVSLTIREGRLISLIGPSGCGKSTLFNIIAGLLRPTTGDVLAQSIVGRPGYVGYMLQKSLLLPWRTIMDNIILASEIRGVPKRDSMARAQTLIERYGLGGFEQHYPHELSGGMRQRTSLLRTMLYDRDVVLLDEPFEALDAQTRLLMQSWLLQVWSDLGKTILFVTHDIDEAIYLSDEIYVRRSRAGSRRISSHALASARARCGHERAVHGLEAPVARAAERRGADRRAADPAMSGGLDSIAVADDDAMPRKRIADVQPSGAGDRPGDHRRWKFTRLKIIDPYFSPAR
jgi:ABC-type nitrate/sulfonate/bicarbonate transport system ATPase subunit